jgi:hypothetical protein
LTNYPSTKTILSSFTHTLSPSDIFQIFPSGSIQNYRICAQNGVGEGACGYSEILADEVPTSAEAPVI